LPVAIEELKKILLKSLFEQGFAKPKIPQFRTDKKVAVIGSGPAGLAAAYQLNQAGHQVTVFERDSEIGLLRFRFLILNSIKILLKRRVNGWNRKVSNLGLMSMLKNYSVEELNRNFDAVVLALGSTVPRDLMLLES
jgi:glutamate synthase (NADPH/NADH) small chain